MKVNRLAGRWVLVTGAGAGIGRAIALDAAGRGGSVAICDINPEHLEETCTLLAGYGVDVISSVVDDILLKSTLAPLDKFYSEAGCASRATRGPK